MAKYGIIRYISRNKFTLLVKGCDVYCYTAKEKPFELLTKCEHCDLGNTDKIDDISYKVKCKRKIKL